MSKVKGVKGHDKRKAMRSLRRQEEQNIKSCRMEKAHNKIYRYARGYRIKDERLHRSYIYETIPEHKESVQNITGYVIHREYWYDEEGYAHYNGSYRLPVYTYKTVVVPKSVRIKRKKWEYIAIKPYIKRINIRKKWLKQQAAKAARKAVLSDGSMYKKAYSIACALW